ncbi:MAG TPA: RluA family pseudouridine synthase [Chloroflexi bacterium]|nr:MAG: RluA family pseudouridine synthase [Chloroflexota bacterium]HDD55812.1 RluA family pseudouridine synthase [Chloroflexota bacterium]
MSQEPIIISNRSETELRLDKLLAQELEDFSRSYIQKIISAGGVSADGYPLYKKAELISPGVEIEVIVPQVEDSDLQPEEIPLDILYENGDCIVINKPAGMVVHPALGHNTGTLVQAVLAYAPEIEGVGGVKRPGLVHRLDQNTSGVILLAKNDRAHQHLQDQFRDRKVGKTYLALVDGRPPSPKGRIEVAIGRDPKYRQRMAAVQDREGKEAVSEFFTLEEFSKHTLLKVSILTGRTHQIRVHLAFLGCPVTGDTVYGRKNPTLELNRQFLHAHQLTISLPGEDHKRTFEAPLPDKLEEVLGALRH